MVSIYTAKFNSYIYWLPAAEEGSKFRGANEPRRKISMAKIKSYGRLLK